MFLFYYSAFGASSVSTTAASSVAGSSTNSSFIVISLVSILAPIFSLVLADFPNLSLK